MLYFVVVLPFAIWIGLRLSMPPGPYEMDSGAGKTPGTFFPHLIMYSVLFYAFAGLGIWGAVFAWTRFAEVGAMLLLFSAVYALLFNGWMAFMFETYMHQRYVTGKSPYTLGRYAVTLALAGSTVILLLAGIVATVAVLAR